MFPELEIGTHIIAARAEKLRGFAGSAELGDVGFNAEVTESGTRRFGEAEQDGHLKAPLQEREHSQEWLCHHERKNKKEQLHPDISG